MARQSTKAKKATQAAVKGALNATTEPAIEQVEESQPIAVVEPIAPTEVFEFHEYSFEYYDNSVGLCHPILKKKGDVVFSGWLCKDRDSAKALVIAVYYQVSGLLKGDRAAIIPEMLGTHPLSALIYANDNTKNLEKAVDDQGNRTSLHPVVVNPCGLALSGNTRLSVIQDLAKKTGTQQLVHVVITDGTDDVEIIVGGNIQRVKTVQDCMNEAIAMTKRASAKAIGKFNFQTEVRNAFIKISGMSGGIHDAGKVVMKFVAANAGNSTAKKIDKVNEQNPTVALELTKIVTASKSADGTDLPKDEAAANVATEINKMARLKSAKPIQVENVYPGLGDDLAEIRLHYQGERIPVIAEFLSTCTADMRAKIIQAKRDGDKQKLSILKESIEREETFVASSSPDWNAQNDAGKAEEEAMPLPNPDASYFQKMRQMGIPEDYTWITNKVTAQALNEAIGGKGDVDPFAEKTGHLQVDRRILAVDRPVQLEDWGGGVHQSGEGLKVVTALPPSEALIPAFTTMMERIENSTIAETAFIADVSVLMIPRFTPYFTAIPFAYVIVSRQNNSEAVEGFGFEPSPYLLSNPRFAHKTEADWNEATRGYVILYYGTEYDRFERACGKFGIVLYNAKAAAKKSLQFEWLEDSKGILSAVNDGIEYSIEDIAGSFFLSVDGDRKPDHKYKRVEHAKRAAVIESLGI